MQATYHLNTDDLTIDFLESIKTLFKQKTVEISIIDEDEEDFAFAHAIEQGLKSENVSKEELLKALNAS
ncbi:MULTISPECIES: hypothetical protein [unclassified Sulfuricurvum]|jgi:uncharacterized protein YnzC (UPF0291/DUF896 family)|uniref:hypothetical protein n=1 Tax=unclassified Sulfuricurvum TaxID=2632390 RepID=UPI0002995C4E|nr:MULTISPECIES: hypothetical protein [unclassified Sulfuricurvum]AFV96535.1 hypothetical protein B649_01105 [Candidatus Sulfuricurvum sp. RIFRC-1]OHD89595.1 MAG: hypothetical protein A3G19_01085 [Sulfuricurvum sp. RIFCSPLOWO2_12_FULL_43_24]HBM35993.1 hypothetical protein [Sulfuricurvum sp.]